MNRPTYPAAAADLSQIEDIHGYSISDPYRWMENDQATTEAWIEAQQKLTQHYLEQYEFEGLEQQVKAHFSVGYLANPQTRGDRTFFVKRDGDMEQAALYVRDATGERVLINPNQIDPEFKTAIDWAYPSPNGKLLAYGLSKDGSENSTLYILDVETNTALSDTIPEARHASLAWTPDSDGFYYTRYEAGDRYNRKAYYHKLGDDPQKDALIFGEKRDKTDWTSLELSDDGHTLLISEHRGWSNTDLYLFDTKTKKRRPLLTDLDASILDLQMVEGKIYALTNYQAPKSRLVAFTPQKAAPEHWETVIQESDWPIESFQIAIDRILTLSLKKVSHHLNVFSITGECISEVTLPTFGMIESYDLEKDTGELTFVFNSFFHPPTLYGASLNTPEPTARVLAAIETPLDPDLFEAHQVTYPSFDGTRVNMFIVHKKGLILNGSTPTLLYGYGGFQVNMAPYFSRRVATWIDRGGVYAVANIRGGGEYGEAWHEAGMRGKKFQVFKDFEYAARYLITKGYTRPAKLVLEGGSNGGLLVGAMTVSTPYLFALGMSSVGLYDMIRYHRFPPGELWVPEYGSTDNPDDTGYLLGYSPYHQVLPGVRYPAFFGHTADTDTRVHWVHTAKFVAALQAATASDAPILFHIDRRAGHGQGKGMSDVTQEYIDKFKIMFSVVGDPATSDIPDVNE